MIRLLFLLIVGVIVGVIGYEAIMLARVSRLRSHHPVSTSLMDARAAEARSRGQQPRRLQSWVPLERISVNLQRAVLAGEDTNFTKHRGFDYEAIQKAWEQAQREAEKEAKNEGENDDWIPNIPDFRRGASTITQQLAKNLYLSSERSFLRKGQEAILTVFLESMLSKRRILELYLNVIEWGDGIYGAEAAAQHYFRKPALSLNATEAAFLSAIIPNPRTVFNPQKNPRRVARRQRIILRGMPYVAPP
ncbi:MAG TPA: transglycosylase domain-containing protein [Pyrinomonadaceae bacterium]|nr:transglycosylase domain-containing protein [Pyrinomonadaceae bacterium]